MLNDGAFYVRYIVASGIDIRGAAAPLALYLGIIGYILGLTLLQYSIKQFLACLGTAIITSLIIMTR